MGDTFYLPHNLDFRGRAYPIPPNLNHIGDDLSRGLLIFGETKPLGERGLRWLKIHLANLYGFDKGNFDEREKFVAQNLDDIYDSAENPLEVCSINIVRIYHNNAGPIAGSTLVDKSRRSMAMPRNMHGAA